MQDLTVEQHSTWNGSVLNCPIQRLPSKISNHQPESIQNRDNYTSCLALLLPSKWSYYFYITITLMSAHHSLRLHILLKTVFGKTGYYYQAYCNTYKTHVMATHHGGSGDHLDRDIDETRETQTTKDTNVEDTQDFHPVEKDHFENWEHNNPTILTAHTREVDDLHQCVEAGEKQPTETLNCIECKLQRLSIFLNQPAPTEPLWEVMRHFMNTLCSAQNKPTWQTPCYRIYLYLMDMIPHT